jgi:hypothetical protein
VSFSRGGEDVSAGIKVPYSGQGVCIIVIETKEARARLLPFDRVVVGRLLGLERRRGTALTPDPEDKARDPQ